MFPQFNIYSTPLLILILQGLIFAFLLSLKFRKTRKTADLLIVILLLITAYHRTTYVIGFMGWYDTFKNTKVNYYLISLTFAIGPLIYLYTRTTLVPDFKWRRKDWLHFIPVMIYVLYRLVIWRLDSLEPEWNMGYDGRWHREFHLQYFSPVLGIMEVLWESLYLAFSVQLVRQYSKKIKMFFSNTYKVELTWLKLFLAVYTFLFVFSSVVMAIDGFFIDLHYTHFWWNHLFSAIAIVLLGMKAYFTDLSGLHQLTFDIASERSDQMQVTNEDYSLRMYKIKATIEEGHLYLNPDLNLNDLASNVSMSRNELSEVINNGFLLNFNELINQYRVEDVKKRILDPDQSHLSLVAMALDSGFRSKATFNRVFKQLTGLSPSQYKKISQEGIDSP